MFKYVDPKSLIDYSKNAKNHPKDQLEKLARAFKAEGFHGAIIVDENNVIIAGHGRKYAAILAGLETVPIEVLEGLTEEQKRSKRLGDNKLAESDWLDEFLKQELSFLKEANYDITLSGFSLDFLGEAEPPNMNDPDECPDVEEIELRCAEGDIWQLGNHRLMVGDSTDAGSVSILLNNEIPILMSTDPPYGVKLDQSWRDKAIGGNNNSNTIKNDDIADWTESYKLFPGNIIYVWHAPTFTDIVKQNISECEFDVRQMIIWNKSALVLGRNHYHWKHESCWYAVRKGKDANWVGDRKQTTVWDATAPNRSDSGSKDDKTNHPSQKPIILSEIPILNHTKEHDGVYDPFGGSGTTLIACEKTKRKCFTMELDPKYASVIVERWEKYTGKIGVKIDINDV